MNFSRRSFLAGICTAPLLAAPPLSAMAKAAAPLERPTRVLRLYNQNTREHLEQAYMLDGTWNLKALGAFSWLLRDWRENIAVPIDARLFDVLYVLQEGFAQSWPIGITSGHRTAHTNASLRETIPGVAKNSLHIQGQAIDFWVPARPPAEAAAYLVKWGFGGVGLYSRWIHVDTGPPRFWDRR